MEPPSSSLSGCDRTFHIDWLRKREAGHRVNLGYGNQFSKVLYSSVVPYSSWEQSESMQGVHHGGVFNLEFSPDGSLLVAACEKRSFLMFDALSQKQIHAVQNAHSDCVNCVRFLDSRTFVTCSDDSTVALWDARNLKSRIRTLNGHSNWVKNIEYSQNDSLLVTSGFDGSIYTWDINSYTEDGYMYERVFHTNGLMRTRLTPDASKMIICTTGGFLMIIHDLNLRTLSQDLHGFKPNMYRLMQQSQTTIPSASHFTSLFSKKRKRNRIEFISDFPSYNDAEVVSSLQIHPQGWCALSRNISHEELSEWTCIHDIQDRDDEDSVCEADETAAASRGDVDDAVDDDRTEHRGFRGFPNPIYNSEGSDSDSGWEPPPHNPPSMQPAPNLLHANAHPEDLYDAGGPSGRIATGIDLEMINDPQVVFPNGRFHALLETTRFSSTTSRLLNDSSPLFQETHGTSGLLTRRAAHRPAEQRDNAASRSEQRRNGNIRRIGISGDGQVQISDDNSSGEPAPIVRVVEAQGPSSSSQSTQRTVNRARGRVSRATNPNSSGGLSLDGRNASNRRQAAPRRSVIASRSERAEGGAPGGAPARSRDSVNVNAHVGQVEPPTQASSAPRVETANAAAAVGAARQARVGGRANSPFPQNMELHVASADVWEALVVIQEARARRQLARSSAARSQDRRERISRFVRRVQDLRDPPRQQDTTRASDRDVSNNGSATVSGSGTSSRANAAQDSAAPSSSSSSPPTDSARRLFRLQRNTGRSSNRQAQGPAAIALGHLLRSPSPGTSRTLVMVAPNEGGAQNIHLRVSQNTFSFQSQQIRMPRNQKIHQNIPRLSHYIEEPNVGKGFIKELCFSSDGRVICSPFSYGIRLLAFTSDCQEISTSIPREPPVKLYEVSSKICHTDYVVSSKFSPTHCLLVSGCLKGKIVWHQPVL